jgi:two-component system OmpR family response regulator
VHLSPQEYRLLAFLMQHSGRVVPQRELTEQLYAQDFERESNAIEVLVGRVRRKLGGELIQTRRGFGYLVEPDAAGDADTQTDRTRG